MSIKKKYLYSTINNGKIIIRSLNRLSLLHTRKKPYTNVYLALSGKRRGRLVRSKLFKSTNHSQ